MDEMKHALLRMKTPDVMRRLLRLSFKDIQFRYELLTPQEKALVTEEEFAVLVEELES